MKSVFYYFACVSLPVLISGCGMDLQGEAPVPGDDMGKSNPDGEEPIGEAEQPLSYVCRIDTQFEWHTCNGGPVQITSSSGEHYRAKINMNWNNNLQPQRRVDIFAEVCDPSGWALHLSDSPTGTGFGDRGTADHQAQAYLLDDDFYLIGNTGVLHSYAGAAGQACETVHFISYQSMQPVSPCESRFSASGHEAWYAPEKRNDLYCLSYTACPGSGDPGRGLSCDWEDRSFSDRPYVYVGINRAVDSDPTFNPPGSGIRRACIVVNDADQEPANCLDPWPYPQ